MVPLGRWKGTQPLLDLVISCVFVFGRMMSDQDMAYSAYNHYRIVLVVHSIHLYQGIISIVVGITFANRLYCYIRISKFQTLVLCPCLLVVVVQIITVCCS